MEYQSKLNAHYAPFLHFNSSTESTYISFLQVLTVLTFLMSYISFYTSADMILTTFRTSFNIIIWKNVFVIKFLFSTDSLNLPHPLNDQNLLSLTKAFLCSLNPLVQNSVQQNYLPELYPLYSLSYQKIFIYFYLACCPHFAWTVLPLPPNLPFGRNPVFR